MTLVLKSQSVDILELQVPRRTTGENEDFPFFPTSPDAEPITLEWTLELEEEW
jgi:hypothetical protein